MSYRVVHFEIHADDPQRAIKFYSNVFNWEFPKYEENEYWFVLTAPMASKEPGINGGLLPRRSVSPEIGSPVSSFVCTVNVDDFDSIEQKILKEGGKVAAPKMPIVGMAWIGYFHDTEGNIFGIFQEDKEAK